jgi:hypothetical protein
MAATETISTSEFTAKWLSILDCLAGYELERIVVTKRGKPVAVLTPPERPANALSDLYGFMRGSVTIADDVDLTEPVLDEPLTADDGGLHG